MLRLFINSVFLLFLRKVYREREQAFETSMKLYQDVSPMDVGVPSKLFPQDAGDLQGSYPYESAVQELRLLITDCCPQRKLECIGESHCVFTAAVCCFGVKERKPVLSHFTTQSIIFSVMIIIIILIRGPVC